MHIHNIFKTYFSLYERRCWPLGMEQMCTHPPPPLNFAYISLNISYCLDAGMFFWTTSPLRLPSMIDLLNKKVTEISE